MADNSLLVLVFCAIGALLFAAFAPDTVVGDTWMSLVSGREIVDHGLPHVDHLTVYGAGKTWTDQQWLAHLVLYGSERLGGLGLVTLVSGLSVLLAYGISLVVVRARGATTRATLLVFVVVLFAAPWTWTVRAQVLVLPLFAAVVALAVDARDGLRRRSWLAIPILLVWGNLHGSAFLGASIVSAVGVLELVRRRRALQAAAFAVAPWLALLVTPYGPVATVRYYRLLLVDPPFADVVSEWDRPGIGWATIAFGILLIGAVILLVTGWRGFALTEVVVLALTAAVALQAIRGIYWFSIACLIILPPAIDRATGLREPPPLRKVGRVVVARRCRGPSDRGARRRTDDGRPSGGQLAGLCRHAGARSSSRSGDARLSDRPVRRLVALDDSRAAWPPRLRRAIRGLHTRPDRGQRALQRRDGQELEERHERLPHRRARQHRQDVAPARLSGRAGNTGRLSRRSGHDRGSRITRLRALHGARIPRIARPMRQIESAPPNVQYELDRRAVPQTAKDAQSMAAPTPPG